MCTIQTALLAMPNGLTESGIGSVVAFRVIFLNLSRILIIVSYFDILPVGFRRYFIEGQNSRSVNVD